MLALAMCLASAFSPRAAYDVDAATFFTAAAITDATQKSAVNQLVLGLKAASLWSSMKAIYPFVGGAATPHSFNLKNPATFQITWGGSLTHNANGVTGNGSTGYGDTGFTPTGNLTNNNNTWGFYDRSISGNSTVVVSATGASDGQTVAALPNDGSGTAIIDNGYYYSAGRQSFAVTNQKGFWVMSARSTSDNKVYIDGSLVSTRGTFDQWDTTLPTTNFYLLATTALTSFSPDNIAFFFVLSVGLSSVDVATLNGIQTTFQTALGR